VNVVGLFAGIGGLELGLSRSGGRTLLLCEWDAPAQAVLRARFPEVPVVGDVGIRPGEGHLKPVRR
jgi:DNA (cytosine-5)-methyltransferase 1